MIKIGFGQFAGRAQDKLIGNSNQSLLNANPSFARSNGSLRDQTIFSNQLSNSSDNVISIYNCVDAHIEKLQGELALS